MFGYPIIGAITALFSRFGGGAINIAGVTDPNRYVVEGYVQPDYIAGE